MKDYKQHVEQHHSSLVETARCSQSPRQWTVYRGDPCS